MVNDDSPSIEDISNKVYLNFAMEMHKKYVPEGKICEKCSKNLAVRINRWGPIKACCNACLEEEMAVFKIYGSFMMSENMTF